MSGLAFLFPGQGSQRPGMGASLRVSDPALIAAHWRRAAAASGLPIERLCTEGAAGELTRTDAAQPALFAVSLALADVARTVGLRPAAVAGHSLGECTASVVAGALTREDGVAVVAERGRLMAEAQRCRPGAMAAIVGPASHVVEALCVRVAGSSTLAVANFNAPRQTVVSGDVDAVERLLGLVRDVDGARGLRLPVGAAFHSELMHPVQQQLARILAGLRWRGPEVPLASNASGSLVNTASAARDALMAQAAAPVRWVACVRALVDAGCRHFLELGPGHVLAGLVRQIAPEIDVAAADSRGAIEAYAASRPHLVAA
jgi:[acyl-carrier-protein] S-malonyltransferase